MTWQSEKLRNMLAEGWAVKGFAPDYSIHGSNDQFYGDTKGFAVLLQKDEHLAIAHSDFDTSTGESYMRVEIWTEDR
jgi:hypothetical protein